MLSNYKRSAGFTIIEALIAVALLLVFVSGIGNLIGIGLVGSEASKYRAQAAKLAEEGMETMYSLREAGEIDFGAIPDSDNFITNSGEYYQPTLISGTWSLGAKSSSQPPAELPAPFDKFTRTVMVTRVNRTPLGLACSGEIVISDPNDCDDYNTRKITVKVSWMEQGITKDYTVESFLTNI
jgi:Tfp pilus assembly protein PilV